MSDNWVIVIPLRAGHVPPMDNAHDAKCLFEEMAPDADEIGIIKHEGIQFFDCGSNLEEIECPHCKSQLDSVWWGQAMSLDYDEAGEYPGFLLKKHLLPCCSTQSSLNELKYDFNQAFGRFALSAMNPNIGALEIDDIAKFEVALGCKVTVVYQHI